MTDANVLVPHQSGFCPQHSCTTALTSITDSWLKSRNEGNMIATLYTDPQTAFDCINHSILLQKLKSMAVELGL